jgi:hypothetical protein
LLKRRGGKVLLYLPLLIAACVYKTWTLHRQETKGDRYQRIRLNNMNYIYIYIYINRERERERESELKYLTIR